MFGTLSFPTITPINNILITSFTTHLYIFNNSTELCIANLDIGHQSPIIALSAEEEKMTYLVKTVGQDGIIVVVKIHVGTSENIKTIKEFNVEKKISTMVSKAFGEIASAAFIADTKIVFILRTGKAYVFDIELGSSTPLPCEFTFTQIITSKMDQNFFLISDTKLRTYSKNNLQSHQDYTHSSKISSVTSVGQNLAIGDIDGKIKLIYDYFDENPKNQKFQSVLEWHTGPVLALASNGQYIYSGGEENVVVLWHVRDLSRDFLPRVRTTIESILIKNETNEIICGLADNTIKLIDLGRDKETKSFRTIVNPKGYAPLNTPSFTPETTNYYSGRLSLVGLPGEIQFVNLDKNGENKILEVVPRNLVASINNDLLNPHRICSFKYSKDGGYLIVALDTGNGAYLKFYRRGVEGFELVSKIEKPHSCKIKQTLAFSDNKNSYFLTLGQNDLNVRLWAESRQKKKSIVDTDEVYWRCYQELKFRNTKPKYASINENILSIVFGNSDVVIYEIETNGSIKELCHMQFNTEVKQAHIIEIDKSKSNFSLLILENEDSLSIWNGQNKPREQLTIKNTSKLRIKETILTCSVFPGKTEIAVILKETKNTHILILNRKQNKFTESYDYSNEAESAFWKEERLVIIGSDLTLTALDGKEIISYEKLEQSENTIEEESTEVKLYERDIFKLNERWVESESIKNGKKIEENLLGLNLLPSCTYAWEQFADKITI